MKHLFLPALLLLLVAACNQPRKSSTDAPTGPSASYEVEAVYELRDKATQARLGIVRKHRHATGELIYWVSDNSGERRGFVLENNRAYKYEWVVGRRSTDAIFVGADTVTAGSRRILDHQLPVTMEPTTLRELAAEYAAKAEAPKVDSGDGCGCGCGCGCGDE